MNPLFKPTSYQKGAALAVGATFVWKVISFANALFLALYFGADRQTDVYFYLIMLVGFGVAFLQRLNQSVLIPEAMFLTQEDETKSRRFTNMWLFIYGGLCLLIGTVGLLGASHVWRVFSRFSGPVLAQDRWLLTCGFFLFGLQIVTYYLTAVAEMYKFFKTAWLGVLNALCPLVCLLILGGKIGIISMIYGFLGANLLQIVILLTLLKTQLAWNFTPAWVALRVQTRQNMLTGQTLAILDILNSWLPIYLMSGMSAGLVSALNYCKQFTDSTTEIFTARVANVAKIEMTEQASAKQGNLFNQTFLRLNHVLLTVLVPLVVFSCYFAPQIVVLFFKRGQFDEYAVQNTVTFLRPMLLTILLLVPAYLQNNTLSAWRKIKENFPYSLGTSLAFMLASLYFIPRWGAFSYPYIYGGALLLGWGISFVFFHRYFSNVPLLQTVQTFVRLVVLNVLALVPAVFLYHAFALKSAFNTLLIGGSVFMAGYVLLLKVSKDGPQFLREIKVQKLP